MKKEWLYLRFFDESKDLPTQQLPVAVGILLILLHALMPIALVLLLVSSLLHDPGHARMWASGLIAASLCVTLVELAYRRHGHARNQVLLTACFLLLAILQLR